MVGVDVFFVSGFGSSAFFATVTFTEAVRFFGFVILSAKERVPSSV